MKRIMINLALLIVLSNMGCAQSKKVNIEEVRVGNFLNDNKFTYGPISAIDGNTNTAWAFNRKGTNDVFVNGGGMGIKFKEKIVIDKIRIINGYGKNDDLYIKNNRVKYFDIDLYLLNKGSVWQSGYRFGTDLIHIGKTNLMLVDNSIEFQDIDIKSTNTINYIVLGIKSIYPGSKYDDTCISEIEFWNKGEKCEIGNLNEVRNIFKKQWREKRRSDVMGFFISACYVEFAENTNDVLARWKSLGVNTKDVELRAEEKEGTSYVEFTEKKRFGGKIRIMTKSRKMKVGSEGEWFDLVEYVELGEWKVDEFGNVMIKIGKGQWKKSGDKLFEDTDFGKLNKIFPVG